MLQRVLEEEVMDTLEDAEEYAAIDNQSVNDEFVRQALELAPPRGRVLDIGTGPGDIAVLLAQRAPGLEVLAIDLGEHMLKRARANVERAGLGGRVTIAAADAKETGLPTGQFPMIVSNSLVHHIPEPEQLFLEIKRLAAEGGGLFIKDLHRPDSSSQHRHLVETYAADCTPYQRRAFSDSLLAGLTVEEVQAICRQVELWGVEIRRCSDRHWCLERRWRGPGS